MRHRRSLANKLLPFRLHNSMSCTHFNLSFLISLLGWYEDNWYEVNLLEENIACTKEEMRKAAEGHLTTEALMWNQNNQTTISGMKAEDFR